MNESLKMKAKGKEILEEDDYAMTKEAIKLFNGWSGQARKFFLKAVNKQYVPDYVNRTAITEFLGAVWNLRKEFKGTGVPGPVWATARRLAKWSKPPNFEWMQSLLMWQAGKYGALLSIADQEMGVYEEEEE